VPAPEDVLGFRPGDDRRLASWASTVEYFKRLSAASNRVRFEDWPHDDERALCAGDDQCAGESRATRRIQKIQAQLADPRYLGAPQNGVAADKKARELIARGKTIVLITCGVHSTEVGSYLSSMLIAHRLASSNDADVQNILRNTIVLLVPSLNPDGVDIVKNWYDKTLGTFEGTEPPVLYNKYTGHDDNRDWYAFTQRKRSLSWTKSTTSGIRRSSTTYTSKAHTARVSFAAIPSARRTERAQTNRRRLHGTRRAITNDMRAQGFKGITTDSTYDAWTPARAYSHYHGGVRILSKQLPANSPRPSPFALKICVPAGFDPRRESASFAPVWPGGEWHLRDITNYMTSAAFSLMKHAAQNRESWLQRFYEIRKEAMRSGRRRVIRIHSAAIKDEEQSRRRLILIGILGRAGIIFELMNPSDIQGNKVLNTLELFVPPLAREYDVKDLAFVVRMDQPYASFAKALLENQEYPNLRDASGNQLRLTMLQRIHYRCYLV
jgi:hypothetical protein